MSSKKLVTQKQLRTEFGIPYSPQHLARLEAAGMFPRRIKLQAFRGGRVAWLESEVLTWLQLRLSQRD